MSPTQLVTKDADRKSFFKRSMLAAAIMAFTPLAYAQDNSEADESIDSDDVVDQGETVVTGIAVDLENAQEIKRNADTVVDSIDSAQIGSLPDRSVLEAMQRIPGVSIERFAAKDDPDHFSAEGSSAVVRGLTFTRSEFNGRDSFTADSSRGLSWSDVSPEMLAGVDVFKNQTADMIEGGIAGTVSLRTRTPFDQSGRKISISADMSYGDLSDTATPTFSGLFSDIFTTDLGDFGVLFSYSNSQLKTVSQGAQLGSPLFFSDEYDRDLVNARDLTGAILDPYIANPDDIAGAENLTQGRFPQGAGVILQETDRERTGISGALQWRNPEETMTATLQYIRSDSSSNWNENSYLQKPTRKDYNIVAAPGTELEFDEDGQFVRGNLVDSGSAGRFTKDPITADGTTLNEQGELKFPNGYSNEIANSWRGGNGANSARVGFASPSWGSNTTPYEVDAFGVQIDSNARFNNRTNVTEDVSFNFKWDVTENLELSTDFQYIDSSSTTDDMSVALEHYAAINLDLSGDEPSVLFNDPWLGARDNGTLPAGPGSDGPDGPDSDAADYFRDQTSYTWRNAMDHYERSEGESFAARIDAKYSFEDVPFLRSVRGGLRFADREQTYRWSRYNWGSLSPNFTGQISGFLDQNPEFTDEFITEVNWGSNFADVDVNWQGGNTTLHPSTSLLQRYQEFDTLLEPVTVSDGTWTPAYLRDVNGDETPDTTDGGFTGSTSAAQDNYFLPSEVSQTNETNVAAYARLDFGSDDYRFRFSGNVGLRYVEIEQDTSGAVTYPNVLLGTDPYTNFVYDSSLDQINNVNGADGADGNPDQLAPGSNNFDVENASAEFYGRALQDGDVLYARDESGAVVPLLDATAQQAALSQAQLAFGNGGAVALQGTRTFDYVLPSFNLKVELTDELIARMAIARAIALPDIGDIRRSRSISFQEQATITDGVRVQSLDENGVPEYQLGADQVTVEERLAPRQLAVQYDLITSSGGNPFLNPMESDQIDLSLEWYFADVGSLTGTLFYKDLTGIFARTAEPELVLNPTNLDPSLSLNPLNETGQILDAQGNPVLGSELVANERTINAADGNLWGIELAYQQKFDMLPEPWDGLGTQINYTYIDAGGAPASDAFSKAAIPGTQPVDLTELPIEGQSEHTANFVAFYEKGKVQTRLAYSWRSDYLLTSRDVISGYPIFNDDFGTLDGSFFYDLTDAVKVGLQGTNLLNSQTRTKMLVSTEGGDQFQDRSFFIQDRRYALVLRANF